MKQWTVTYRDKSGSKTSIVIEAEDRAGVFAELKQRGINAISITEGAAKRPRRTSNANGGSGSIFKRLSCFVVLVLFLVGITMVWFCCENKEKTPAQEPNRKPHRSYEKVTKSDSFQQTNAIKIIEKKDHEDSKPVILPEEKFKNVKMARPAKQGVVMTLMDGSVVTNKPLNIFKRDFERTLMSSLYPGGMVSGMLARLTNKYSEAELLAMLKEMTVPEEGDNPTVSSVKNRVQALKEEILQEIARGRTAKEVLMEIRRIRFEDNSLRAEAMKLRAEALRGGDPELARKNIEIVNTYLQERGLAPMRVPPVLDVPSDNQISESDVYNE